MRRVGELAELPRHEVRDPLADVDGVVADPLDRTRDQDHPQPPLAHRRIGAELQQVPDDAPVGAVDQLVEIDERLGPGEIAASNASSATRIISSARVPISSKPVEQRGVGLDVAAPPSFVSFAIVTQ